MLGMFTFSIITPVYNGADFIAETVDSVLNAAREFSFEYLVVDDGSLDSTPNILMGYGSKLTLIRQENLGQSAAISKAISQAVGEYLLIVNADDPLITGDLLSDAKRILDKDPSVVATYPDWQMIDKSGKVIETVLVKDFSIEELVGKFNCLIGPGGVFRAVAAKQIGGWNTNYKFVPDYDFWLRLVDYGKFQHIPKIQATWRTHEQSISIGSRSAEMAAERIRVINDYVVRHPELPRYLKRMAVANSQYRAAVLSYFDTSIEGRKLMLKSMKLYPRILFEKDMRVVLFLLFLPISRQITRILNRLISLKNLESSLRRSIKG